jgi:hypothetical protein
MELKKERDAKVTEYNTLRAKSASDLRQEDLNVLMEILKKSKEEETETEPVNEKKNRPKRKRPASN